MSGLELAQIHPQMPYTRVHIQAAIRAHHDLAFP
jgi:hypothetical protein